MQPCVYFANHASHLDFVLIWTSLPRARRRTVRPVAGRDYWDRTPVRRFVSDRMFHAVLIDRNGAGATAARAAIAAMTQALAHGDSLVVFPEGTRSIDGTIGPFKGGLYHLSRRRPDVDFVPVLLENTHRILPKGHFVPVPAQSRVIFGTPLRVIPGEDKPAFLARAREALLSLGGPDGRSH